MNKEMEIYAASNKEADERLARMDAVAQKQKAKQVFYKVENSWQYTTIYSADGEPFCEFNLEWMDGLTETTQDELDKVIQKRVDHVLKLLNVSEVKNEKSK